MQGGFNQGGEAPAPGPFLNSVRSSSKRTPRRTRIRTARTPCSKQGHLAVRSEHQGVRSEVDIELNFPPKLRKARSRLYRRRFLQVNTRWKALAEIYTMHSFAPCWNPQSKIGGKRTWPKQPRTVL